MCANDKTRPRSLNLTVRCAQCEWVSGRDGRVWRSCVGLALDMARAGAVLAIPSALAALQPQGNPGQRYERTDAPHF